MGDQFWTAYSPPLQGPTNARFIQSCALHHENHIASPWKQVVLSSFLLCFTSQAVDKNLSSIYFLCGKTPNKHFSIAWCSRTLKFNLYAVVHPNGMKADKPKLFLAEIKQTQHVKVPVNNIDWIVLF